MSDKDNSNDVLVKFTDVTKQYGDLVVLDKLNLEIKKNEMVSIIGPSGSGKTTVLRVLMTLEKINQGVIHLDGEPLTHMETNGNLIEASEKYLRERRSKIGMVFQQFNLFPHMKSKGLHTYFFFLPIECFVFLKFHHNKTKLNLINQ